MYRATVVARLTYAASAWRGFIRAPDLQRINSVIDRARRHGYCPADLPSLEELCEDADDELAQGPVVTHEVSSVLLTISKTDAHGTSGVRH